MLKRFFYTSAIILMLAIAYHLGDRDVQAQANPQVVASFGETSWWYVVYENGDVYRRDWDPTEGRFTGDFVFVDNVWRGSSISVQPETWTGVKEKYRR